MVRTKEFSQAKGTAVSKVFLWRREPCAVSRRLWASCSALRGVSTLLRSGKHSVFISLKGLGSTGCVHLGIAL